MPILWVARWRSVRGSIEWLCTQERWNPLGAIMGSLLFTSLRISHVRLFSKCCQFFVYFVGLRFLRQRRGTRVLSRRAGSSGIPRGSFPWRRGLYNATTLALNRSANRRSGGGWNPPEYTEKPPGPKRWSLVS